MKEEKIYSVFMFLKKDGKFHINYSDREIFEIFQSHSKGEVKATKESLPVLLVYLQKFNKEEDAEKRVKNLRKMNRERKILLIKQGIREYIPEVKVADRVQILLHKSHGINGIRYIKEGNPKVDYTVCFNLNCPEHCDNSIIILNKSCVEEVPDKGLVLKNSSGLNSLIKYYKRVQKENNSKIEMK